MATLAVCVGNSGGQRLVADLVPGGMAGWGCRVPHDAGLSNLRAHALNTIALYQEPPHVEIPWMTESDPVNTPPISSS
jgi:hypothetical protein